jgi:hypothetical protein
VVLSGFVVIGQNDRKYFTQIHPSLRRFSRQSRTAWAGISAELTDQDIATAHRYAEASRESLARYERKGGK